LPPPPERQGPDAPQSLGKLLKSGSIPPGHDVYERASQPPPPASMSQINRGRLCARRPSPTKIGRRASPTRDLPCPLSPNPSEFAEQRDVSLPFVPEREIFEPVGACPAARRRTAFQQSCGSSYVQPPTVTCNRPHSADFWTGLRRNRVGQPSSPMFPSALNVNAVGAGLCAGQAARKPAERCIGAPDANADEFFFPAPGSDSPSAITGWPVSG